MTHLSSIRTQRSLNCLWRWCLCCFLCHFFCLPNSSSWLMLSGNRRWGDRLSSSSICRGFREGDVSGTCSESCTAGRAVAEDLSKAGLGFVILELQTTTLKHLMNKRGIVLRKKWKQRTTLLGGCSWLLRRCTRRKAFALRQPLKTAVAFPSKLSNKH